MTAAIKITRDPGGWVDRLRAYHVFVNGKEHAEIWAGEQCKIDIESGPTEVFLKLDFCRSRTVRLDIPAGAEAHLRCRARSWMTVLYGITLGRNHYMRLEEEASWDEARRGRTDRWPGRRSRYTPQ